MSKHAPLHANIYLDNPHFAWTYQFYDTVAILIYM